MFILLIRQFRFFLGNLEPKPSWSTGQVNICVELSKSFWFSDICFCLEAEKPQSAKTKQHSAEPKMKSFQPYLTKNEQWFCVLHNELNKPIKIFAKSKEFPDIGHITFIVIQIWHYLAFLCLKTYILIHTLVSVFL